MVDISQQNRTLAVAGPQPNTAVALQNMGFEPVNLSEAMVLATKIADSGVIPASFKGKPNAVLAAMMHLHELGVPMMSGIANAMVVNDRVSLWGDLVIAMVRRSPLCESLTVKFIGEGVALKCAVTGKRKGEAEPVTFTYSWTDAVTAGNALKDTYKKYPQDMVMWKAIHRLIKFLWPDILHGIAINVHGEDLDTGNAITVEVEPGQACAPRSKKAAPQVATSAPAPQQAVESQPEQPANPQPEPEEVTPTEIAKDEPLPGVTPETTAQQEGRAAGGDKWTSIMVSDCRMKTLTNGDKYYYVLDNKGVKHEIAKSEHAKTIAEQSKVNGAFVAEGKEMNVLVSPGGTIVDIAH